MKESDTNGVCMRVLFICCCLWVVSVIGSVQVPFLNTKLLHRLSLKSLDRLWMREVAQEIRPFLLFSDQIIEMLIIIIRNN